MRLSQQYLTFTLEVAKSQENNERKHYPQFAQCFEDGTDVNIPF